jgi:ATP phosphoribosyltransferase regulatory subunit
MERTAIPKGVRVYPPAEAAQRRAVEEAILSVFRRWGFREVITPTFEYLEVFTAGAEPGAADAAAEQIDKFVDRRTGRLLALRSDLTPQVARLVATTLRHHPLPLRLCYAASVFRYAEAQAARHREFVQLGVELIGLDRPEADAEMVAMAVEGCRAVGLSEFQIDVGQVEYFRGLLKALAPPPEAAGRLVSAVRRKDAVELELLLGGTPGPDAVKAALAALPTLYGGPEILDRAAALAAGVPRCQEAMANLRAVYEVLVQYELADHVLIDLGEARALEYHNGVVFGTFVKGLGFQLSSGGRYDRLLGQFGYPCPATGFAFELEKILMALQGEGRIPEDRGPDFLIIDFNPDKRHALRLARILRGQGYAVARDIIRRPLEGSLEYCRTAGVARAIILGAPGAPAGTLLLRDVAGGGEARLGLEDFCRRVARGERPWGVGPEAR